MTELRNEPGSAGGRGLMRWGLPAALLTIGGVGFALLSREPEKPKLPAAPPQLVRTKAAELRRSNYPVVVRTHGVVRARQETTLSSQVAGKIVRMAGPFEDGGFFAADEVLVELESEDYRNAVAVAEARRLGGLAALQLAQANHDRNLSLLRESLLPVTQADLTAASLEQARAEVQTAEAQLERARRDLERTRIRAPFEGCVRRRSVGLGQLVGPGTPLATVFAVDAAEVRLPIAGRELKFLGLGEAAPGAESLRGASALDRAPSIEVELRDAVDRESPHIWKAHVVRTESALDENSLEVQVIARVEDPFGLRSGHPPLRLGQPVTAALRGRTLTNVLALPRAAVRELDRVVTLVRSNLTLRSKRITPLWSDESHIVVDDPALHEGLLLATTHLVYAPDGARAEIITDPPADAGTSTATNAVTGTNRVMSAQAR